MGNSPSSPPISQTVKPQQFKPKRAHFPKTSPLSPVEPTPPPISKVFKKDIKLPQNLNKQKQQIYQETKDQLLQKFKTKFLAKVSRKELRLIFKSPRTASISDNPSGLSQFSDRSILKLERSCELDHLLYSAILQMRWKCIFAQQIKTIDE